MKEVEHPDPDIFRMCELYLCCTARRIGLDFAELVWLTTLCEQIFPTLRPSQKKDTSQERLSSAREK